MDKEFLERLLIRGKKIPYMGVNIKQPTIKDLDEILLDFSGYQYIYSASKDFLQFEDGETIEDFKDFTYFQTLFKLKNKIYLQTLILSLIFFIEVKVENIHVSKNDIVIHDDEGNNLFILDDNNFEEFAELIRLICCWEKMKAEEDDEDIFKINPNYSSNADIQRIYERAIKQHNESERKKKKENSFTLADIIGAICINERTKYKFKDIDELTIWQLYYIYNGMFVRENNEFTKMQFCSYKFSFDEYPNFNWIKEAKVKLPISIVEK